MATDDWKGLREDFQYHCVYCGKEDSGDPRTGLVPDHIVPRCMGGELVVGNVLPACHDCNDRRGAKHWEAFLITLDLPPNELEERLTRIRRYLVRHPYQLATPESRLPRDILKQYQELERDFAMLVERARTIKQNVDRLRVGKNGD